MGGCANSKYAADEDKEKIKPEDLQKKINEKKRSKIISKNDNESESENEKVLKKITNNVHKNESLKNEKNLETKREIEKATEEKNENKPNSKEPTNESEIKEKLNENDDEKKEVTTYQTTVVKHSQKEGDDLLQHLRDEAFKVLQNLIKKKNITNDSRTNSPTCISKTTTKVSSNSNSTSFNESASCDNDSEENILENVKKQVIKSLGGYNQNSINLIMEEIVVLIKNNKVTSMNELQSKIENNTENEKELIKKVINSATGYLTAKGTEAGILLSNILANSNPGIQGIMNETEKTTVKVTRTVTEQFMNGGQIKSISKMISSNIENSNDEFRPKTNIELILKNLTNSPPNQVFNTFGSTSNTKRLDENEINENKVKDIEEKNFTKKKAEEVVSSAVNAAVEIVKDESTDKKTSYFSSSKNDLNYPENDVIKLEEENTIKFSTTKFLVNSENNFRTDTDEEDGLDKVQQDFYRTGKEVAEELVKTLKKTNIEGLNSN